MLQDEQGALNNITPKYYSPFIIIEYPNYFEKILEFSIIDFHRIENSLRLIYRDKNLGKDGYMD
ncbi:hypothetical protein IR152_19195 [Clostridioides sp. ES-S-0108-01]|nr:hypothetical protein [Clostridioides sp. ES-S-0077-01]MCC0785123.1 hypothetical protein [Clostridioides sp. ES-S-0108-01]